ncbi:MAG: FtsQ-type POTRA domain-containing protein [Oscillospiraceae bacterium]
MPNTPRQKPRRKKKKRGALYAPIAFIIICAALVFGMSVFFRVSRIEVSGNSLYTAEEIMDAAGIEKGDNLFFTNRSAAVSRIYSKLPYISEAEVTRSLPNRVTIEVTESSAIACVSSEAGPWLIDRNCKLLTPADAETEGTFIRVDGLVPINPSVGALIAPGEADDPKVAYLADMLNQIERRGLTQDVTWIDISSALNPSFDFQGRFTVKLGANDNTEYKFGLLLSAVSQLAPGDTGFIDLDLSVDNKAHFSPA